MSYPNLFTILFANASPTPFIFPFARYFSNDDKSAKLENTDLDSNKDATTSDEIEEDKKSKKRKEKLEEFSSYASSTDTDTNATPRKKGKHF